MSLKAFHIFFILISSAMTFGFAVWAFLSFKSGGNSLMLAVAVASCVAGFGLIIYGVRFLKKLKHVSFI
jgi:hypothetical protein